MNADALFHLPLMVASNVLKQQKFLFNVLWLSFSVISNNHHPSWHCEYIKRSVTVKTSCFFPMTKYATWLMTSPSHVSSQCREQSSHHSTLDIDLRHLFPRSMYGWPVANKGEAWQFHCRSCPLHVLIFLTCCFMLHLVTSDCLLLFSIKDEGVFTTCWRAILSRLQCRQTEESSNTEQHVFHIPH